MNKKKIVIGFIIITLLLVFALFIKILNLKEIKKYQIDVSKFITCVDEVSYSKAQVNWKDVASIIGVEHNNNFKNVNDDEIKKISELFIIKEENTYKIDKLENVLEKLNFNSKQIKRVHNYINDLKYYGLKPSRLNPDTKYMKFINSIKDSSIDNYEKYNILPSITIAQAILESNWGESELSAKYNNLFGIKAHSSWKGDSVNIETSEYYDKVITDEFRAYKSKSESIKDHAKFLSENPRYKDVLNKHTYIEQAQALQDAGYSTVSDKDGNLTYKNLLIQIIQQYNLQLIDSKVQEIKG